MLKKYTQDANNIINQAKAESTYPKTTTAPRPNNFYSPPKPSNKKEHAAKPDRREDLIKRLDAYIARIEKHKKGYSTNFKQGFWLFKESRAANREANYLLAKHLRAKLNSSWNSVEETFPKLEALLEKRKSLAQYRVKKFSEHDRDINSSELNGIISLSRR